MESLKNKLRNRRFKRDESGKEIPSWKIQAEEMSKFFKRPIYHLFWDVRWNKQIIFEAYKFCLDNDKPFQYFMKILLNKNDKSN